MNQESKSSFGKPIGVMGLLVVLSFLLQACVSVPPRDALPEELIDRTVCLANKGLAKTATDILGDGNCSTAENPSDTTGDAVTVVRLDRGLTAEGSGRNGLIESTAVAAWSSIESGLHFASPVAFWHTCPQSGDITSASGDGSLMFLDDTASDAWFVNASEMSLFHDSSSVVWCPSSSGL